jgi:hypothetical protein
MKKQKICNNARARVSTFTYDEPRGAPPLSLHRVFWTLRDLTRLLLVFFIITIPTLLPHLQVLPFFVIMSSFSNPSLFDFVDN